ncbi:hypothetical protein GEMRC1_005014 [Eukaryota sp. GEM-RC1]
MFLAASKLLFFGTVSTLLLKSSFQTQSVVDGHKANFNSPWFMTFVMHVWSTFFTPTHTKSSDEDSSLLIKPTHSRFWFFIPTLFDLAATATSSIALSQSTVPSSLYQLLGASLLIFTTINARIFLKRKQNTHQWIGVLLLCVSIVLVACSATLEEAGQEAEVLTGIVLLICAQLFWSGQFVVEELLLQQLNSTTEELVGWEGVFGSGVMIFVFLPVLESMRVESSIMSIRMIINQPLLIAIILVFMIIVLAYNIYGQRITQQLSSVHRTVIESLRSLTVWVFGLTLGLLSQQRYGEEWTRYSWVKGIGFLVMFIGSLVYNGAPGFKLKGLMYND